MAYTPSSAAGAMKALGKASRQAAVQPVQPTQVNAPVSYTPTAYQQNLQTVQAPTIQSSRDILGQIYKISQKDQKAANQFYSDFQRMQMDPTSPYYNPYNGPTNQAVGKLKALGVNVDKIDDDWFNANSWMKGYYNVSGTTNNPTSPGKKATAQENMGYQYYQVLQAEENTRKAEREWAAMQEEIAYWATQADRNYSDDEILKKIDWSKYKTLQKMDETRQSGTPMELNRAVGYSRDALYGTIWAARNGGGLGDSNANMAASALGYGKSWQKNPGISAKLDIGNIETYSPYSVGSTMDDERLYFGASSFNDQWLVENRARYLGSGDETAIKMYGNVVKAEEYTQKLETELAAMKDDIANLMKYNYSADDIIDMIQNTSDYKDLFDLDETLKTGKLKATTRKVDYRWRDVEKQIRDQCTKNESKKNAAKVADEANVIDPVTGKPTPVLGTAEQALEDGFVSSLVSIAPFVIQNGTDDEKTAMQTGMTGMFNQAVQFIMNGARDAQEHLNTVATDAVAKGYLQHSNTIGEYEKHQKNRDNVEQRLGEVTEEWKPLDERYTASSVLANMTAEEYQNLEYLRSTLDETGTYDAFWEEAVKTLRAGRPDESDWNGNYDYDQALHILYQRVTGVGEMDDDGLDQEARLERAQQFWNQLSQEGPTDLPDFLSAEEKERYDQLTQLKGDLEAELEDENWYLEDEANLYNMAKAEKEQLAKDYVLAATLGKLSGKSDGDISLLTNLDYLYDAGQDDSVPPYLTNNALDLQVASGDLTREEATTQAAGMTMFYADVATRLAETLAQLDEMGVPISDEQRANVERKIKYLQKDAQAASYVMLDGSEDFDTIAKRGRAKAERGEGGATAKSIATGRVEEPGLLDSLFEGYWERSQRAVQVETFNAMTDEEKNRYFYLLEKDGQEAADAYFDLLTDPEDGVLLTRRSEERQQRLQDFASQNFWTGLAATGLSFATNVMGGTQAVVYEVGSKLTGKSINPYNSAYDDMLSTGSLRGGVKTQINNWLGEDTTGGKIGNLIYDALTSAGDSYINAQMMGALFETAGAFFNSSWFSKYFSGLKNLTDSTAGKVEQFISGDTFSAKLGNFVVKAGGDFAHASTMGMNAAAATYRDVFARTRDEEKAAKMAIVTFFAETGSEAITVGNLHEAFAKGQDVAKEGLKGMLIEFIKNGGEEFLGEGVNEWISQNADRLIMGADSDYEKNVQKYLDMNYPESVARQLADRETWKDILYSAATGFVSSTFGSGAEYVRGMITPSQEQQAVTPETVTTPTAVTTPETVTTPAAVNDSGIDPGLAAQDAAALARIEEAEAAMEAIANQLTKDMATLGGVDGTNATGAAVSLAAVLNTGNSHGDKAAAQAMVSTLAGGDPTLAANAMKAIILAAPGDTTEVKQAVSVASIVDGAGQTALKEVFGKIQNGEEITSEDVNAILSGVKSDQANDPKGFAQKYQDAIKNSRIAARVVEIMGQNGAEAAINSAKESVKQSRKNLGNAQRTLDQANADVETAESALTTAVDEQLKNAADTSLIAPVEQAANQLEGATHFQQEQEAAVASAEENLTSAQEKQDDVVNEQLTQARAQATTEIEQQMAQEAQEAADAAQQAFLDAQAIYPSVSPFSAPVTLTNGLSSLQLTGIYGEDNGNYIYATPNGYISDADLYQYEWGDTSALDTALNEWNANKTPVKPAMWLPHSLKASLMSTGEVVDIIGFAGQMDSDPVLMDSNGNLYASADVKMQPDPFTGDNGNQALFNMMPELESDLPEMTREDIYGAQHPDVQMPEGFVAYPGDPVPVFSLLNGTVNVVGMIPQPGEALSASSYVLEDGSTVPVGNVTEPVDLLNWAMDQLNQSNSEDQTALEQTTPEQTQNGPVFDKINNGVFTVSFIKAPSTSHVVDTYGDQLALVGLTVAAAGNITAVDTNGDLIPLGWLTDVDSDFAQWAYDNIDYLKEDNFDNGISMVADETEANAAKQKFQGFLPEQAQSTATTDQDSYSEGKVNPKTGEPLKNWQDPQYHGKVQNPTKKLHPKSKAFKKFFDQNPSEALPYVTNPDGTPRIFYRGYGAGMGNTLYTVHQSKGIEKADGTKMYANFYMDKLSTAKSYAGTSKISHLRNAVNWETAKAAMQDIGYDLIEAPNANGEMGYQVTKNGHTAHNGNYSTDTTWFAENELARFRNTYGGGITHQGIHAGYIAAKNPLIIDCHGSSYSSVQADVTAPDGATLSDTMKTRKWAYWAFQHGYDSVIFDNVRDNMSGGGEVGTEIVTSQSNMFKSVYNQGTWDTSDPNILAMKKGEASFSKLEQMMGRKLSDQFNEYVEALAEGEEIPYEELMQLPEVQWSEAHSKSGESLPYDLYKKAESVEEIEALFTPERVNEQRAVMKAVLDEGSAQFDKNGKVEYTGKVLQNRRADIMVGLPASGKSSVADYISEKFGSRILDNDDVKSRLSDFNDGLNSSYLHTESKFIHDQVYAKAIANGDNLVLPVVGHNYNSVAKQIALLKENGYDVHLHRTVLDQNKAVGRALSRMNGTGRYIPLSYLMGKDSSGVSNEKIEAVYERLKQEGLVDDYATWNTDIPRGEHPIVVEASNTGDTDIFGSPVVSGGLSERQSGAASVRATAGIQALKTQATPQTPTQKQAEQTKAKHSPATIAKSLAKALGLGEYIGTRKFGNVNATAYYDLHSKSAIVKNQDAGNYIVVMHELGHAIADKFNLKASSQMVDNLINGLNNESNIDVSQYSPAEIPGEALAEFMWRYMQSEQAARDFAGDEWYDTFEELIRGTKEGAAIAEARDEMRLWVNADTNSKIGSTIVNRSDGQPISLRNRFREAIDSLVDATSIAGEFDNVIRDMNGGELSTQDSVRNMALWANTAGKQATSILMGAGVTDADGNIIGPSLADRFKKAGFKATGDNLNILNNYMLALHSLDRDAQNKPVFDNHITTEEREAYIKKVATEHPEIARAAAEFQEFRKQFMQAFMVDTGRLTQEAFDEMNRIYPNYVPTFRVKSTDGIAQRTGKGKTYTIKRAKGSTENIYNPFDSFCGMVNTIVSQNALNRAALTFDRMYQTHEGLGSFAHEVIHDPSEKASENIDMSKKQEQVMQLVGNMLDADTLDALMGIVGTGGFTQGNVASHDTLKVVRPDGTIAEYQFENMELFKLLAGINNKTSNAALDAVGFITRGMSALTTGSNPIFAARNFMRDFQNSVNYGSWASNYGTGVMKWLASAYEVWRGSDDYNAYTALGGGGWTRIDPSRKATRNELYSGIFEGYETSNLGKTAKWAGKKVWNAVTLARVNEVIEQASRFAEYKYGQHDLNTQQGRLEGYLAAQEATVDFNRAGNSNLATMLKKLVPFFNASTQGVYRTSRMLTDAERGRAPQRFAKTVINTAFLSALCSGILMKYLDDDDKEEFEMLSDDLKSNHFYLPNFAPDIFGQSPLIRIPLAQDPLTYAIHGAVTNAMWSGQTEDGLMVDLAATANTILDNLNPIGSGTVLAPILAVNANKSWFGSRIVPSHLERNKYAADQYTEETPDLFKNIGRAIGMSPLKVQYLAEQYTGFLGQLAIPALSKDVNGELAGLPAAINAARKRFVSDPLTSNDVVNSFYDGADILNSVIEETNQGKPLNILRRGLTQEEAGMAYEEAKELTSTKGKVGAAKTRINELYNEIDEINARPGLTDKERYELTSERRREMIKVAAEANEALGAFTEKYVNGTNMITRMLTEGSASYKFTDVEKLPQTFKDDEGEGYMQKATAAWEATGKASALPHPSRELTITDGFGNQGEYTIADEDWDRYTGIYRDAYQNYVDANSANWDAMTPEEQQKVLSGAHTAGNKAMREQYAVENRLATKADALPQTFLNDQDQDYMKRSLEMFNTTGKASYLPHPSKELTITDGLGNQGEYTVPDEDWDRYTGIYRDAYQNYINDNGSRWETMTDKERQSVLSGAHSAGNKAMREQYAAENGFATKADALPETFKADENQPYMQRSMEVFNATGKASALPHPSKDLTITDRRGEQMEYRIPDEDWDRYTEVYKAAYERYLNRKGARWETLTDKQKQSLLSSAHSEGNKAMKELYSRENGIATRGNGGGGGGRPGLDETAFFDTTGQFGKGNIDLNARQVIQNSDGSISTERSLSFYDEDSGKEILIPTVVNGRILTDDEAIDHYYDTGEYLGMFNTPEEADEYAEMLHNRQDWYYNRR